MGGLNGRKAWKSSHNQMQNPEPGVGSAARFGIIFTLAPGIFDVLVRGLSSNRVIGFCSTSLSGRLKELEASTV